MSFPRQRPQLAKSGAMIPANTTGPGGTVVVYGQPDPAHLLTVYADPRCPYCKRLDNGLGAVMRKGADDGLFTLNYHFATFIDGSAGGEGSLRAVGALGAAADVGQQAFGEYLRVLFANQPPEQEDAFADPAQLLRYAGEVAGLRGDGFDAGVTGDHYRPWAQEVSRAFEASGVQGTPTVLYDGVPVPVLNPMGYPVTPETFFAALG